MKVLWLLLGFILLLLVLTLQANDLVFLKIVASIGIISDIVVDYLK